MRVRVITIPLRIELPESSTSFMDDPRTWDLTRMFNAEDGERFYFPHPVESDETVER
jgi:hypothetical protein